MIKISSYLCILIVLCTKLAAISAKPDCYTNDTHTKCLMQDSVCLTEKSNAALQFFINGIPDLGIEKLDKMFIDSIEINNDGIIHELTNVEVEGLKNATINNVSFNEAFKLMRLSFDTTLIVNCDYTIDGFLFMQPIFGTGQTTYNIRNIQTDMIFFYDIVENENGNHKLVFKDYRYGLHIKGGIEYDYKNLFGGDKEKNDIVDELLDNNWTIINNVFPKKFYDKIYGKIFKAIRTYVRSQNFEDMVLFS